MSLQIGERKIGINVEPFIIAEMSGNHNQSLDKALKIVDAAAKSGAHAIKLQTYRADTITMDMKDKNFKINDDNSLWKGENLYDLYKKAYTPWEWHEKIFEHAKSLGIICFSSPFDETAVDFLEKLDTPAYKIASFENIHLPLIEKVAKTGKPIIISTGMASIAELDEAVTLVRKSGCEQLCLLKCTSTYPANPENTNIRTIPHLKKLFNTEVGLSDHTKGIGVAIAACSLGATLVEKHFTLNRADGGVDSQFSLEPSEMKLLVDETKRAWLSLGNIKYGPTESEQKSLIFRRSIYVKKDIKKGDKFSNSNITIIRPGDGLHPRYLNFIYGKKASKDISAGNPFDESMIS